MTGPDDDWRHALDDLVDRHRAAFQARHRRVAADAGPSLFGGDRAAEHWTFGHAVDAMERASHEAAALAIATAAAGGREPAELAGEARRALERLAAEIAAELAADYTRPAASEFGLRPSRSALDAAVRRMQVTVDRMATAAARGRLPDGMLPRPKGGEGRRRLAGAAAAALLLVLLVALAA